MTIGLPGSGTGIVMCCFPFFNVTLPPTTLTGFGGAGGAGFLVVNDGISLTVTVGDLAVVVVALLAATVTALLAFPAGG